MTYTIDPPAPGQTTKSKYTVEPPSDPKEDTSNLGSLASKIDPGPFIRAIPQGLIGIPEAIYQYGEHLPAPLTFPRPGHWADPLRRYAAESDKTWAGMGGEALGNVLGFAAGGELLDLARVPGLLSKVLTSPAARTEASTLLQSQIAQPSQGDSFWTDKLSSGLLGHLFGRWLGRPAQQAARNTAEATNKTIADLNQRDLDAFRQQQAASRQAAANALSDPNHPINLALAQRKARIDAKAAVPADTTSGWWHRTLQQIDVTDPTLARATPSTGAKVRDVVGGRLNEIMSSMNLDRSDPALLEHLNDIRDEVERNLPENERAGWYNEPPEPEQTPLLYHPTTGKPLERTTRGVKEAEPKPPTGTFYRTVIAPLQTGSGPLTGRELTDYVSRIGARAEELAKEAALLPRERRVVLQAQADALRNVEDAVIGHAAGSPEQKLALEKARRAYFMWAIGNDAARASNAGVATPKQLINSMSRRMRGEARYEQALNDPNSPHHDMTNWLQSQLAAHTERIPSAAETRSNVPPTPGAAPSTPPTPREPVPVPDAPNRPRRSIARAIPEAGLAAFALAHGSPWGLYPATHAILNLIGHGTGGREKFVERGVRALLENFPRTAGRVATPIAGTAAGQIPRTVPQKEREGAARIGQAGADALKKVVPDMYYRWGSP